MSPLRECPICGLVSPLTASQCDCGYRFTDDPAADAAAARWANRQILGRGLFGAAVGACLAAFALVIVMAIGMHPLGFPALAEPGVWLGTMGGAAAFGALVAVLLFGRP